MENWDELRTALVVARLGTVQAAAAELGVHRATVHRRIELLEGVLGTKLFLRHPRGYVLTDEGRTMFEVASRADSLFVDLEGNLRKRTAEFSGELILAIFNGLGNVLMPAIRTMNETHPDVKISLIGDETISRLEYGEAHIAFRAGPKPDTLDYVVQPFLHLRFGLYCSSTYAARHGVPRDGNFEGHRFVGPAKSEYPRPYSNWLMEHTDPSDFALNTRSRVCIHQGIAAGLGIGFMADFEARSNPDLVEVMAPNETNSAQIWVVTHVDLHRTDKVQEFLNIAKATRADIGDIAQTRAVR